MMVQIKNEGQIKNVYSLTNTHLNDLLNAGGQNETLNSHNQTMIDRRLKTLSLREERVALLKEGIKAKDIELLFLEVNEITVVGVDWEF